MKYVIVCTKEVYFSASDLALTMEGHSTDPIEVIVDHYAKVPYLYFFREDLPPLNVDVKVIRDREAL